jgi:hypothetical protein
MSDLHLHIIAFDIPYPPTYGGVIDVFYQIKSLSEAGVKIHLHAFEYGKGHPSDELEKLCFSTNYYPRTTGIMSSIGLKPYITSSRRSELLMAELLKDNFSILFEGLHTCYHIGDKRLSGRLKLFRATNIEHRYYAHLAMAERNLFKKIYFIKAVLKLKFYQQIIKNADLILAVSNTDTTYFQSKFPTLNAITLPCFHANKWTPGERGSGNYVLFHGNLEVAENEKAAEYLMSKVMNDIDYPFIIAGNAPSGRLIRIASSYPNVILKASPNETTMSELITNAKINLLITFQATGLKLKLLNALYKGGFVVANNKMLQGTGLETFCNIADTANEMKQQVMSLLKTDYQSQSENRDFKILLENYDIKKNAERLVGVIKNGLKLKK